MTNCFWSHSCFTADNQMLPGEKDKERGNRTLPIFTLRWLCLLGESMNGQQHHYLPIHMNPPSPNSIPISTPAHKSCSNPQDRGPDVCASAFLATPARPSLFLDKFCLHTNQFAHPKLFTALARTKFLTTLIL